MSDSNDPNLLREYAQACAIQDAIEAGVARLSSLKFNRYFHDCLPGCIKTSSKPADHRIRDGLDYPTCRALYVQQLKFMEVGKEHRERMFLAANRIGKTVAAAYEIVCHMTGLYPHWWQGRTFDRSVHCWAAGDTMETTRNIPQVEMLGPYSDIDIEKWTGLIPDYLIVGRPTRRAGSIPKCIDTITVKHHDAKGKYDGTTSTLQFKSYDQGRRSFQGTEIDITWLDEEPPDDVYSECLTRTATTKGMVICTFTPLQGLTEFLTQYLKTSVMPDTTTGEMRPANEIFWPEVA